MIWRHKWDCTHCCSYWTSILSTTGLTTRSTIENCDVTSLSGAFLWQTNIKSCQNKVPPCSSVSNKPLPPFSLPLSQGEGGDPQAAPAWRILPRIWARQLGMTVSLGTQDTLSPSPHLFALCCPSWCIIISPHKNPFPAQQGGQIHVPE